MPDAWKQMEVEVEWGFGDATAALEYDGRIEAYDGVITGLPAACRRCGHIPMTGPNARSARKNDARRGVRMTVLYIGSSRWRRVWSTTPNGRMCLTILTVWTKSEAVPGLRSRAGPILPENGFVRSASRRQARRRSDVRDLPLPQSGETLGDRMDAIPGVPKVRGWASHVIPWFGVNPTREAARPEA